MNTSYLRSLLTVALLVSSPLQAQDKTKETPAADKSTKKIQCADRHDHAAERGASGMKSACAKENNSAKKVPKRPSHDHNRMRQGG